MVPAYGRKKVSKRKSSIWNLTKKIFLMQIHKRTRKVHEKVYISKYLNTPFQIYITLRSHFIPVSHRRANLSIGLGPTRLNSHTAYMDSRGLSEAFEFSSHFSLLVIMVFWELQLEKRFKRLTGASIKSQVDFPHNVSNCVLVMSDTLKTAHESCHIKF